MSLDDEEDVLYLHLQEHHPMTEEEKLQRDARVIDDSVTFLLVAIFSFFFVVVGVVLFTHWKEKKRKDSGRFIVLPHITLPGYMTVVLTRTPTHRVLGHYQLNEASLSGKGLVSDKDKKNYGSVEEKDGEGNDDDTNCLVCQPFNEGKNFPQQ